MATIPVVESQITRRATWQVKYVDPGITSSPHIIATHPKYITWASKVCTKNYNTEFAMQHVKTIWCMFWSRSPVCLVHIEMGTYRLELASYNPRFLGSKNEIVVQYKMWSHFLSLFRFRDIRSCHRIHVVYTEIHVLCNGLCQCQCSKYQWLQ